MYYNYIYWYYIEFQFYLHKSDQTPKHENALTYRRARRARGAARELHRVDRRRRAGGL